MSKGAGGTRGNGRNGMTFNEHSLKDIADVTISERSYYNSAKRMIELDGLSVQKESSIEYLSPSNVKPSEWNDATKRDGNQKVEKYASMGGDKMPPIIAVKKGDSYEAIDGIHRVWAAEKMKMRVPAIVISERLMDDFSNDLAAREFMYSYYKNAKIKNRK